MNTFQSVATKIETAFSGASDLVVREIKTDCISAKLYFLDAMCDTEQLELTLIRPVTAYSGEKIDFEKLKGKKMKRKLKNVKMNKKELRIF